MRRSKFTEEHVVMALRQAEAGTPVATHPPEPPDHRGDVLPVEEAVKQYGDLGVPEPREL